MQWVVNVACYAREIFVNSDVYKKFWTMNISGSTVFSCGYS